MTANHYMKENMNSPFKFLDSYSREDKHIFFGREAETEALYEKLFESNLILLYGASGTGKTSLINCGVSNKFQDTDWFAMFVRRGTNLNESLHREIRRHAITPIRDNVALAPALKSLYYDYYKPIYLIFDQFEELFILGNEHEQKAFLEDLGQLLRVNIQVTVILSMREEYIASLSEYEKTIPTLFDNRFRLEKINRNNLKRVIEGTTTALGIEIHDPEITTETLIERLSHKKSGIDLTHVQVYLDRLYQKYYSMYGDKLPVVFDAKLVEMTGEFEDVLAEYLSEQIKQLGEEIGRPDVPLAVLYTLVSDDGTKRSLPVEEIRAQLPSNIDISQDSINLCVRRFEEMRILKNTGPTI
ncbi:MAG: ATP-binding protein [Bacteroidia bacterium]